MRLNFTIVLLLFATATPLSVAQEQKARTTPEKLSLEECSLCADGSAPSSTNKSSSAFAIGNGITLTCEDLPTNAITLLDYGLGNSNFVCEVSQLWAYIHCGCPTPPEKRPCWICFDGDINYNQDTIVPNEALEGSCDFQAYFTGLRFDHFGKLRYCKL